MCPYLSQQLYMDLGDSVDGPWSLYSDVRGGVSWRGGAKCSDSAGAEETKVVYPSHLSYIVVALNVHLEGEGGLRL